MTQLGRRARILLHGHTSDANCDRCILGDLLMRPNVPFSNRRWLGLLLAVVLVPPAALAAAGDASDESLSEEEEVVEAPFEGSGSTDDVFSPPGVTEDWGGARSWLYDRGVELSADATQGVQDVMHGGFEKNAAYLGSSELILDVDSDKLGLWPGGFVRVAAEGRWGKDVVRDAGTLSPVNNDALFPADPDRVGEDMLALTEMTGTQFLAPWFGFFGGLVNTTAGDANDFAGFARSNEHFQNAAFLYNFVSTRIVPTVTLGGGIVVIPFDWLMGSFTFVNTQESAGSDPFDTDKGWTFVTEWTVNQNLDVPIRHVVSFGVGFDNDFFRLGELPRIELPPGGNPNVEFSSKDESWAFWYNGQIDVWTHPDDEERKAGPFVRFGYADDETNPIEWNLAAGIGGMGVFDIRPRDRFGIGVYHLEPSDKFPLPALGIKDETGLEAFYNLELTRGINLTVDLQYIDSAFGKGPLVKKTPDNAWVGGLRLRVVL